MAGFLAYIVLMVVSMFMDKSEPKGDKESKFLIPANGGVLQNMEQDEEAYIKLALSEKIKVSDDTFIFRFGFPKQFESDVFGLPIGQHVVFRAMIENKEGVKEEVERKYTPISMVTQRGYIDFLIKIYFKDVVPRFPDGGVMSQHMNLMKIGDIMEM